MAEIPDASISRLKLADSFVPPHPDRPEKALPLLKTLRIFRRNIVGAFSARDFSTRRIFKRVVRTNCHFCNHPLGVRSTLTEQHDTFERKTFQQRHALAPLIGDGLFISDGDLWAQRRAAVSPIIHARNLGRFGPTMAAAATEWRCSWAGLGLGAEVDMLKEMGELTAEIISRCVFGRKLGRAFTSEIIGGFADFQRRTDQIDWLSIVGAPTWVPRFVDPRVHSAARRTKRAIDDILDRFERGEGDPDAVINQLFEARDASGRPLSRKAIRNEAIVIFMAGHETTANTLAWAFYCLSRSPRVRERLDAELAEVLGGRDAMLEDVPKLRYTRAIVDETLRLYPPVPLLGRLAKQPGTITRIKDGELVKDPVKEGDVLTVAPWLVHRNREVWTLPDHFVPERFDPELADRPSKFAFIPFASGPRICPGLSFAMAESVICMATLCQAFAPVPAPDHVIDIECRITLRPGKTLPMRLVPRGFDAH